MSYNKQIILGRIGKISEIRYTPNGASVVNASVATTHYGPKDQQGNREELTTWHRLSIWGARGEAFHNSCAVGMRIFAEGRTEHRDYTDKQGVERRAVTIVVQHWAFADGYNDSGRQPNQAQNQKPREPANQASPGGAAAIQPPEKPDPMKNRGQAGGGAPEDFDDEIPF